MNLFITILLIVLFVSIIFLAYVIGGINDLEKKAERIKEDIKELELQLSVDHDNVKGQLDLMKKNAIKPEKFFKNYKKEGM